VASERYVLKHFYYGQFVRDGQPVGDMRLLAKTHGITDEAIKEALQLALIPPMPGHNAGSWGVIRGKKALPFFLVESERGPNGQQMLHYVILPVELVQAMGGNMRLLHPFIEGDMPAYDKVGNIINPLVLSDISQPDESQEIDDILDFMMFVKNRMNVIESLLAAVVQAVPIYITNAPETPLDRELFVAGLITLLPPSVRFAVTFVTHTRGNTQVDTQIRFVDNHEIDPTQNALMFDWKSGQIRGKQPKDGYSHFIVSQLRLDAELVIRQTRDLTAIANWRMRQTNARLAEALSYASQRVSVDDAVRNKQPIEAALVSRVLAQDPTLSDELRVEYARHLMSFSMALGELEHAEPLGMMLGNNEELADTAYEMLKQAQLNGASGDIFDLMVDWLSRPLGPQGSRWIELTHECAHIYLNDIIDKGDLEEVDLFLRDVDRAGVVVVANKLLPGLIQLAMPVAVMNRKLAQTVLIIACKHVTHTELFDILNNTQFLELMPDEVRNYVRAVRAKRPMGKVLMMAAAAFDTAQRLILVRFAEIAMHYGLTGMVDTPVLKQLVRVALADWGGAYEKTLKRVADALSSEASLRTRDEVDNQYTLAILLALGQYDELARRMLEQSRILYIGDRQADFAAMIGTIFSETPIQTERLREALDALQAGGIRSLPLALAYIGALASHGPSDVTNEIADKVLDTLASTPGLLDVLPMNAMITLIEFQFKRGDAYHILRSVYYLPPVAARYGSRTAPFVGKIYQQLDQGDDMQAARIDMLRRYIRLSQRDAAQQAIGKLGQLLGRDIEALLKTTYAVKLLMNDADVQTFAKQLVILAKFLHDTGAAYHNRNTPTQGALLNNLDSIPGGLQRDDKLKLAADMIAAGKAMCELTERQHNVRGWDSDRRTESLLKGEEAPQTVLEMMRVMGGYLAQGKRHLVTLDHAEQNPHPLPSRSAGQFIQETDLAHRMLAAMVAAYPQKNAPALTAQSVRDELESIWHGLPQQTQRDLIEPLARDLQRVAALLPMMISRGDVKALEDTGLGRRLEENQARPRNVVEFYRFAAGYYLLRA
jgi:hypothetical protein